MEREAMNPGGGDDDERTALRGAAAENEPSAAKDCSSTIGSRRNYPTREGTGNTSHIPPSIHPLKPKSPSKRRRGSRGKPVPLSPHTIHFEDDSDTDFVDSHWTSSPLRGQHLGNHPPIGEARPSADMGAEKGLIGSLRSYPPAVFFMLGNEFCERFSFYGMKAILILYLIHEHHFSDAKASLFYHAFVSLAYFSPLFGSIAADNYFGRFKVILWVSLLYVGGHVLLSIGAVPNLHHFLRATLDSSGLLVIALATGGIKPCVSAFAADQFNENQRRERAQFFSFFYFAINAGSLLAIAVTPILRGRVQCFGSPFCFPLAFGVPGVLMLLAFVIFLSGWKFGNYKMVPPGKGNVLWKVCKCVGFASREKIRAVLRGTDTKKEHWLDYARPKYNDALIAGVRSLLSVSLLFLPVVLFWALFDQQGSTWILQARRMDGRVGPFTILPDQMNTLNPLMILVLVPLFEAFIYPSLRKVCRLTPLRKMAAGGILAALSFIIAGILQLHINSTMEPKPAEGNVFIQRIGNDSQVFSTANGALSLLPKAKVEWPTGTYKISAESGLNAHELRLGAKNCGYVVSMQSKSDGTGSALSTFAYDCEKSENGRTRLYLAVDEGSPLINTQLYVVNHKGEIELDRPITAGAELNIQPGFFSSPHYTIAYGQCKRRNATNVRAISCLHNREFFAQMGSAYVMILNEDTPPREQFVTLVRPNTVNVLWQLPQFVVITLGEVLFSITGLEFSYSQAAPTMKSVLQALWLLTTFFGNLIDLGITGTHVISEPAAEFFFYSFLMFIVMAVFIAIATRYQYVNEHELEESIEADNTNYAKGGSCFHDDVDTQSRNPQTFSSFSSVEKIVRVEDGQIRRKEF